jgi:hypothetical protein
MGKGRKKGKAYAKASRKAAALPVKQRVLTVPI